MSVRPVVAILLLGSVLGAPWAAASEVRGTAKPQGRTAGREQVSADSRTWLRRILEKAGCMLDPAGSTCVTAQVTPPPPTVIRTSPTLSSAGCLIDPAGCSSRE